MTYSVVNSAAKKSCNKIIKGVKVELACIYYDEMDSCIISNNSRQISALCTSDGSILFDSNTECTADLQTDFGDAVDTSTQALISYLLNTKLSENKEAAITSLDYLINRSPISSAFKSRSAKKAIKDGFVLINHNAVSNYVVAAFICMRAFSEHTVLLKPFHDLVNLGVPEHFAYCFAPYLRSASSSRFIINEYGVDHFHYWYSLNDKSFINYIKGSPVTNCRSFIKSKRGCGEVSRMWGDLTGASFLKRVVLRCVELEGDYDKDNKIQNPFKLRRNIEKTKLVDKKLVADEINNCIKNDKVFSELL